MIIIIIVMRESQSLVFQELPQAASEVTYDIVTAWQLSNQLEVTHNW